MDETELRNTNRLTNITGVSSGQYKAEGENGNTVFHINDLTGVNNEVIVPIEESGKAHYHVEPAVYVHTCG